MALESITVRLVDRVTAARDSRPYNLAGQNLTPGRVVKASVVGPDPGGKGVLVRMLGTTVLADSKVDLRPGQALTLTVEETEPRLVLTVGDKSGGQAPSRLPAQLSQLLLSRQSLPHGVRTILNHDLESHPPPTPAGREIAQRLQSLVRDMLIDPSRSDPKALKEFIGLSGQTVEARLARGAVVPENLRGLAAALTRELSPHLAELTAKDPANAAALRALMQAADGLKSWAEAGQTANAELLPRESLLLLAIPLALGQDITQGELLLGLPEPEERESENRETSLVFFLELTALGPLTVEAGLGPGRVRAEFITDSPAKAGFLEERLAGLQERLTEAGFQAVLGVRLRPAAQQEAESPLAELIRRRGHYLSLTV